MSMLISGHRITVYKRRTVSKSEAAELDCTPLNHWRNVMPQLHLQEGGGGVSLATFFSPQLTYFTEVKC